MIKVLFVCLGNICRSPMAEGSFKALVESEGFIGKIMCDSAGTSAYHVGESPDRRMYETALSYNINLSHCARQLVMQDFNEFDYILAMDKSNLTNINKLGMGEGKAKVLLFRDFDHIGKSRDVPDPYYGGLDGFKEVFEISERCSRSFLNFLIQEHSLE